MVPGYHLEGPFLNPTGGTRGCHPASCMVPPDAELLARLRAGLRRPILLLTLAPELPGALALIRAARAAGTLVAIGHCAPSAAEVAAAAEAGAVMSTHLGNGLPRLLPKLDNPLMAQLAEDRLAAGFIADGIHLPVFALKAMLRAKGIGTLDPGDGRGLGGRRAARRLPLRGHGDRARRGRRGAAAGDRARSRGRRSRWIRRCGMSRAGAWPRLMMRSAWPAPIPRRCWHRPGWRRRPETWHGRLICTPCVCDWAASRCGRQQRKQPGGETGMDGHDFAASYLAESLGAMEALAADDGFCDLIEAMAQAVTGALRQGGKLLIAGNGGSAADAQHIAGELVGRLMYDRAPLAAVALTADASVLTATGNDYGYEAIFERQVLGIGKPGDVFLGISTSATRPMWCARWKRREATGWRHSVLPALEAVGCGRCATCCLLPPHRRRRWCSNCTSPPPISCARWSSAQSFRAQATECGVKSASAVSTPGLCAC